MIFPRVTLTMVSRQSVSNLQTIEARRQHLTAEVSSGLKVRNPSDDPAGAAAIIQTSSDLQTNSQFLKNLQGLGDQLQSVDGALSQAITLVQRAQSLASEAANFNQTAETRSSIATEVAGLIQNLIAVANTSFGGKYVFADGADGVLPFVADPSSTNGVIYRGGTGQRSIAFPGGTLSPVSADGESIFLNPSDFTGSGRTAGVTGTATPAPPVGIGVSFSHGATGAITADLPSFFVAPAPPTVPTAGDQITVHFISADGAINSSITATLAGGETAAQIASALNAQIAATPALAGKITFSDQGGNLKIVESDTVGQGFTFTASDSGTVTSGLESGGVIGGESAQEIAAALNAQVASNPELSAAKINFSAANGEIKVTSAESLTFTAVDFDRGTGFVSGMAGTHSIGGSNSANVFQVLTALEAALRANDGSGIQATLEGLQAAVAHLSNVQGFYGAAEQQIQAAVNSLQQMNVVNQQKLSSLQDTDVVQAAADLSQIQASEQAALEVAANQQSRPNLFNFLA